MDNSTHRRVSGAVRFRRICAPAVAALLVAATACWAAPNQFVILSDIHPHGTADQGAEGRLTDLTEQLLRLRPAFVVQVGDFCGDPGPDPDMSRLEHAVQMFHRLREAGIDVYPVMGNHDIESEHKINFLCAHIPAFNLMLDRDRTPAVYDRWCRDHRYWMSFDRGGIHFVIIDSNLAPRPDEPEMLARYEAMVSWLAADLCAQAASPKRPPTLLFMHHPEYVTGDRGCTGRPVYRALLECPDHTVEAVFGGHWHYAQQWPAEQHLGARCYATPASVLPGDDLTEYTVATVEPDRIIFKTVDTATGGPGTTGIVYQPVLGSFGDLGDGQPRAVAARGDRRPRLHRPISLDVVVAVDVLVQQQLGGDHGVDQLGVERIHDRGIEAGG